MFMYAHVYTQRELVELDNSSRVNHPARLFFFPSVRRTKRLAYAYKGKKLEIIFRFCSHTKRKDPQAYSLFSLWALRGQE